MHMISNYNFMIVNFSCFVPLFFLFFHSFECLLDSDTTYTIPKPYVIGYTKPSKHPPPYQKTSFSVRLVGWIKF